MKFGDSLVKSTGAFLQGELERFDPKLYEPIAEYTWGRDIQLRQDVTLADETTSFALMEYGLGSAGAGIGTKAWATQAGGQIPTVSVGINKVISPVTPWAMSLDWTLMELEKAQLLNRPIDVSKLKALQVRHQRDIDEQVYVGDKETGAEGLVNRTDVATKSVGAFNIKNKTAQDFLDIINTALGTIWEKTQYQRLSGTVLLPPSLAEMLTHPYTLGEMGGFTTIGDWVRNKSLYTTVTGRELTLNFCRWLNKGVNGLTADRIVVYDNDAEVVRFPLVELQHTPVQYNGIKQSTVYYGALGQVEVVRPELLCYADLK